MNGKLHATRASTRHKHKQGVDRLNRNLVLNIASSYTFLGVAIAVVEESGRSESYLAPDLPKQFPRALLRTTTGRREGHQQGRVLL